MKKKLKLLASFSGLQLLVQGVSAVGGLLLIRTLEKSELAAYTIALSLQTILSLLTDLGIGSGLNAIGGRVWKQREALSRLVATAFAFRTQLALLAVPVGVGFSLVLFRQIGVPWIKASVITGLVLLGLWSMWAVSVYTIPLRLHGRYLAVQGAELMAAALRLLLFGTLMFVFLDAIVAVVVVVAASLLQAVIISRMAQQLIDRGAPPEPAHRAEMEMLVKKQYFPVLFYAFRGQITIWLIALFGTVENVAEVGALSRLGILFAMSGSIIGSLVIPTIARCDSLARLKRLFATAVIAYLVFGGILFLAGVIAPEPLLWLIGPKYSGLTRELPWLLAGSVVGGFAGLFYALASARAWIWHAWISPVGTICLQLVLLFLVDLREVQGVLAFAFFSTLPGFVANGYLVVRGLIGSQASGQIIRATAAPPVSQSLHPSLKTVT